MNRFTDEALIEVSSGNGGNGCIAFRREKFVPHGGPSGGDGGRGGDVIFTVRSNLRTLSHLRYQHKFKAENGRDGEGSECFGRNGADCIIPVPPGAVLKDEAGTLIHDFGKNSENFLFLRGGNGGWGNVHFKSSVQQAPRKALPGQPGTLMKILVELQIMADIGFVGLPNAGKSSLLDRLTNARPKIAPYPFTTKIPNLGVLHYDSHDVILADIPGIIEGASNGAGLGIRFLKHIARTSALAFLIDLSDDGCLTTFDVLQHELAGFSPELLKKKRIVIATKLDLDGASERLDELKQKYQQETVMGISVFSGAGISEIGTEFLKLTRGTPPKAA
ncbi:MAG: GTPase ObgE [Spirochaetaceae bacterium]|nr:GTPase ObgE [Spirochaetaceae bacterium]